MRTADFGLRNDGCEHSGSWYLAMPGPRAGISPCVSVEHPNRTQFSINSATNPSGTGMRATGLLFRPVFRNPHSAIRNP
jgi:hypothetical protein